MLVCWKSLTFCGLLLCGKDRRLDRRDYAAEGASRGEQVGLQDFLVDSRQFESIGRFLHLRNNCYQLISFLGQTNIFSI